MARRKGFTIPKVRGLMYWLAKILGDINAVLTGKIFKRIIRRAAGKVTGRALGKLTR